MEEQGQQSTCVMKKSLEDKKINNRYVWRALITF